MPVTRSAAKKLRQDKKRQSVNLKSKNAVKDSLKKFKTSPTAANLQKAFSLLDKMKKKKIWHANKVNRLKSALSRKLKGPPSPSLRRAGKSAPAKAAAKKVKAAKKK